MKTIIRVGMSTCGLGGWMVTPKRSCHERFPVSSQRSISSAAAIARSV